MPCHAITILVKLSLPHHFVGKYNVHLCLDVLFEVIVSSYLSWEFQEGMSIGYKEFE